MIDLFFIRIRFGVGLADTFGDYFGVALLVACEFAVLALHASRILQKISAQGAAHYVVELLQNELVSIKLVNFFLSLPYCALPIETNIEWSAIFHLFGFPVLVKTGGLPQATIQLTETDSQVDPPNWL